MQNPDSNKFCGQCGSKLEVNNKCPKCGTTFPSEGIFCPECGTRVRVEQIEKDRTSGMDTCHNELEFVIGSCRFKMIKVEGGTFTMGATKEQRKDALPWECPAHQVTLTDDYYIGQTEVSQALWKAVMGNNPSYFKGDHFPVTNVSWYDSQTFIEELTSLLSNELGGKRFALPTEAQWEFAARGGNQSKGYKYAGSNNIDAVAWCRDNSGDRTHPVAQKQPNELGLYDMSGNVWEWCQDWYGDYSSNAQTNPLSSPSDPSNPYRVHRGGSWVEDAKDCRVSFRRSSAPGERGSRAHGFRLCLLL